MTVYYPRVYRYRGFARFVVVCLGAASLAVAGFVVSWYLSDPNSFQNDAWAFLSAIAMILFFGAMGIVSLLEAVRSQVTLYSDRLVYQGWWHRFEVRRADVRGARNINSNSASIALQLVLKDGQKRAVKFCEGYDDTLADWFDGLDNLDAIETNETAERIFDNLAYGTARDIRERRVRRDQSVFLGLYYIGLGLAAWGAFWPKPLPWCMAGVAGFCLLPVILVSLNRKRWTLHPLAQDNRLPIGSMVLLPCGVLALRAWAEGDLVDWIEFLAVSGLSGLIALQLLRRLDHPSFHRSDWQYWPLYAAWFAGVLSFGNWYLDDAKPKIIPVDVVARSKGSDYTLTIGAWGSKTSTEDVDVPKMLYDKTPVGGRLCINLYPGRLSWEWYEVRPCQSQSNPST